MGSQVHHFKRLCVCDSAMPLTKATSGTPPVLRTSELDMYGGHTLALPSERKLRASFNSGMRVHGHVTCWLDGILGSGTLRAVHVNGPMGFVLAEVSKS